MSGICGLTESMVVDSAVMSKLKNIQNKINKASSSSLFSEIEKNIESPIAEDFKKVFKIAIEGNSEMLNYCLDRIYYGSFNSMPIFKDTINLATRKAYIKSIFEKIFSDWLLGQCSAESVLVALNNLVVYNREYATEVGLDPLEPQTKLLMNALSSGLN